jgi:hypothetical protein
LDSLRSFVASKNLRDPDVVLTAMSKRCALSVEAACGRFDAALRTGKSETEVYTSNSAGTGLCVV